MKLLLCRDGWIFSDRISNIPKRIRIGVAFCGINASLHGHRFSVCDWPRLAAGQLMLALCSTPGNMIPIPSPHLYDHDTFNLKRNFGYKLIKKIESTKLDSSKSYESSTHHCPLSNFNQINTSQITTFTHLSHHHEDETQQRKGGT